MDMCVMCVHNTHIRCLSSFIFKCRGYDHIFADVTNANKHFRRLYEKLTLAWHSIALAVCHGMAITNLIFAPNSNFEYTICGVRPKCLLVFFVKYALLTFHCFRPICLFWNLLTSASEMQRFCDGTKWMLNAFAFDSDSDSDSSSFGLLVVPEKNAVV